MARSSPPRAAATSSGTVRSATGAMCRSRSVAAAGHSGLDVPVVIGGIVPDEDLPTLAAAGVAGVLGPGSPAADVVACVRAAVAGRGR